MRTNNLQVAKSVFEDLHLKLVLAGFGQVSQGWGRTEFVPTYNRLYYVVEGKCSIKAAGREFVASGGHLVVIPAGFPLSYRSIRGEKLVKFWCHFSAKIGHMQMFQMLEFPPYIEVLESEGNDLRDLFDRLLSAKQEAEDITALLKIHNCLSDLIIYLIERARPVRLNPVVTAAQRYRIHSYIEEHLAGPLSLEQLAAAFHYSPNYFIRYFKSIFHVSPHRYITQMRLEKGQWLLENSKWSVGKIADIIGMKPIPFAKMFKQATALTPTDYRRLHAGAQAERTDTMALRDTPAANRWQGAPCEHTQPSG
ncbi:helix-turn-helix domain-containing protein [Paenibacillus xerothermodurans]|nr:AraC family transcriptional regulator [Paenibacillus xerothermodurans]